MAQNLVTRQEFKQYADIKSNNHDAEIDSLIPKVSYFVHNYCRRDFLDWFDTPRVDISSGGSEYLILSQEPVLQVQSVEISDDYGQTWEELQEFQHWVQEDYKIIPTRLTSWPKRLRGYRVTYTAGYETTPDDLKLAVMDLIKYYRQNDGSVHSVKAPGTNSVQIEHISSAQLPSNIKRVLDLYVLDYT